MTDDASADVTYARHATVQIVSAYLSNANTSLTGEALQALIRDTFATLSTLGAPSSGRAAGEPTEATQKTKMEVRRSIGADSLISFEDGKPYKSLKRHLGRHGLTPEAYRAKYGLPADYPMVHPAYSAQRSALAKSIGLGSRGKTRTAAAPKEVRRTKGGVGA